MPFSSIITHKHKSGSCKLYDMVNFGANCTVTRSLSIPFACMYIWCFSSAKSVHVL